MLLTSTHNFYRDNAPSSSLVAKCFRNSRVTDIPRRNDIRESAPHKPPTNQTHTTSSCTTASTPLPVHLILFLLTFRCFWHENSSPWRFGVRKVFHEFRGWIYFMKECLVEDTLETHRDFQAGREDREHSTALEHFWFVVEIKHHVWPRDGKSHEEWSRN